MVDKSKKNNVEIDVDAIIDKLRSVSGNKPGKLVNLTE
jgi:hypothetical protein